MTLIAALDAPATVLICGASQGIGLALCERLLARPEVERVYAVARQASTSAGLEALARAHGQRLLRFDCDARDGQALAGLASEVGASCQHLHLVISTLGILQKDGARAEKSLAQLDLTGLQTTFATNAFAPVLLLKHLLPLLRKQPATFVALSARVGSIDDNQLGGWYSYRASKAALNQLLRTASIELRRINPGSTVLLVHPGTTDTQLSQPFQANVPAEQLFTTEFAAQRILDLARQHGPEQSGSFWAWDGKPISW